MALMSYAKSLNGFVATGPTVLSGKADTGDDRDMAAEDTDGGEATVTEDTSEDEFTAVEYTSGETSDSESSVSAAEGTDKNKAPRSRKPLQLRSLDDEERFLKYLEPLLRSAHMDRREERAVELIKVLWLDRFPDCKPALRWRPDELLDSHPGWWALYFKERYVLPSSAGADSGLGGKTLARARQRCTPMPSHRLRLQRESRQVTRSGSGSRLMQEPQQIKRTDRKAGGVCQTRSIRQLRISVDRESAISKVHIRHMWSFLVVTAYL
ncbi:hypothetical protein H0H93_009881 [Arthromyces matolae]|nr:hypothetical protein H0H93_009881 [Arthromyces matolae]